MNLDLVEAEQLGDPEATVQTLKIKIYNVLGCLQWRAPPDLPFWILLF
jgi:hypothetical protein